MAALEVPRLLDWEMARTLADLMMVEAAVVEGGKILHANPSLRKSGWELKGWKVTEGHYFWEICEEEESTSDIREWYEQWKAIDQPVATLQLRQKGQDASKEERLVIGIRLETHDLLMQVSDDADPVLERFHELETLTRMFKDYLKAGVLGLMVLQDDGDREGVIRYMSKEGAAILDRDLEDLVDHEVCEILAPGEEAVAMGRYRQRMRGKRIEPSQEVRFITPNGDVLVFDVVIGSTTWEQMPAAYVLFRDETSRVLTLEELRRFALGFEMVKDTIVLADKNLDIIYINPTGLERSGYTFEEVQGRSASIFAAQMPDEGDPMELAATLFEQGHWTGERTAITKDGRTYPVELSASMSKDPNGDPDMLTLVSRDITSRREAERNLIRARERAEFFTDLLSHDINNYIQAVRGWLDVLSKEELGKEQMEVLQRAQEQAGRVSDLIARVRALSKTRQAEELKPMDLSEVMDETVWDLRQKYRERPFEITFDPAPEDVSVLADDLLKDLFMNVLDNAIKYSPGTTAQVDVSVQRVAGTMGKQVQVSIADRGPGIADEDKTTVFYRFVKKLEDKEGSGLGLSLVMALAERYGGRVWIEDRVPEKWTEGVKVVVELPEA
jgi:PAS domain S-box-containing protein